MFFFITKLLCDIFNNDMFENNLIFLGIKAFTHLPSFRHIWYHSQCSTKIKSYIVITQFPEKYVRRFSRTSQNMLRWQRLFFVDEINKISSLLIWKEPLELCSVQTNMIRSESLPDHGSLHEFSCNSEFNTSTIIFNYLLNYISSFKIKRQG